MRYFWSMLFMSLSIIGYGQKIKLGFRSGVSFSNFYSHNSSGQLAQGEITTINPNNPLIIIDPNAPRVPPSYYYETDFVKDMRVGFFSYLHLDWEIRHRLSAEIGLGYAQRGIELNYDLQSTSFNAENNVVNLSYQFDRNLRLDYIVIPFTIQYKLDKKERFYVLAGIYNSIAVNFLIKESLVITDKHIVDSNGNWMSGSLSKSWTTDDHASFFDAGLVGGFGLNLPVTKNLLIGIDIRGAVGVINIPKKYNDYGFQGFSETSKNISFETGLSLQCILK